MKMTDHQAIVNVMIGAQGMTVGGGYEGLPELISHLPMDMMTVYVI